MKNSFRNKIYSVLKITETVTYVVFPGLWALYTYWIAKGDDQACTNPQDCSAPDPKGKSVSFEA